MNIPRIGFGTARLRGESGKLSIRGAIATGYRHFDTAKVYGNEELLGNELKEAIEDGRIENGRKGLFITSKLWNDDHQTEQVEIACRLSLKKLKLDYLDLYLIHWPCSWKKGTLGCHDKNIKMLDLWKAMEKLVSKKLVLNIGVSNFGEILLKQILKNSNIKPFCNQIEIHPRLQQEALVKFCQDNNIIVTAWSPLGKGSYGSIFDDNDQDKDCDSIVLNKAIKKRNISSSELVLLWHLTRNIVAIPRSSNLIHMNDNLNVLKRSMLFDNDNNNNDIIKNTTNSSSNTNTDDKKKVETSKLELLDIEEMKAMSRLDKGERLTFDFVGAFEETKFPWTYVGKILYFIAMIIWSILPHWLDFKMPS